MAFFNSAINILGTLVVALGGGVCAWGGINLLEGYGNDNPGAKSQGVKQLMAGAGIAIIGLVLIPQLATLITVEAGRSSASACSGQALFHSNDRRT